MDEKIFEKERNSVKLTIYSGCSPLKTQDGSQVCFDFCHKTKILIFSPEKPKLIFKLLSEI